MTTVEIQFEEYIHVLISGHPFKNSKPNLARTLRKNLERILGYPNSALFALYLNIWCINNPSCCLELI